MDARLIEIRKLVTYILDAQANLDTLYNQGKLDFETYVKEYRSYEKQKIVLLAEVEQIIANVTQEE